ncbi:uncharacterized protein KY384_006418 [Bacidia gigantensis]|uniref:uncharacterized protein n=1 Tax=Bacidia gigantensis TaxID=2732470 RepID=UPI001D04BF2A|nr:uncharacterized protein KY384_006418 [Bacidia gigantensis]KAG8528731.1 hypothetical protein KY384_006418 [Bacidia gigantensis]
MVEYKGRTITDFFKAYSRSPPKRHVSNHEGCTALPPAPGSLSVLTLDRQTSLAPNSTTREGSEASPSPMGLPQRLTYQPVGSMKGQDFLGEEPGSTPTLPSSQRVVKNGEVKILDSDDERQSDTSSLEDLDEILMKRHVPQSSTPRDHCLAVTSLDLNGEPKRPKRVAQRDTSSPQPQKVHKFSLQTLAKQRKAYESSKEDIVRTKQVVEERSSEEARRTVDDAGVLENVMQNCGDHEDIARLKAAINRTEALLHDVHWSWFAPDVELPQTALCPLTEDPSLCTLLSDLKSQQQAFLGGLVDDYAMKGCLPRELLAWTIEAACTEPRDDLRQAYKGILSKVSPDMIQRITANRIEALFTWIGASQEALQVDSCIEARSGPESFCTKQQSLSLESLVDIMHHLAPNLCLSAQIRAIIVLCRLLMDTSLASNRHFHGVLEPALTAILAYALDSPNASSDSSPVSTVLCSLRKTTKHPKLRVQLLRNLPLLSPDWLMIRRQLALVWFFEDDSYIRPSDQNQFSIHDVCKRLSTPTFALDRTTDFALFTSSIQILDFALDSCSRLHPTITISPHKEKAFNDAVDELAAMVKGMFMKIIDCGASDMRRTEAKEVLEGLQSRLLYTVRTKPRRRKNVFGNDFEEYMGEKEVLNGWIGAAHKNTLSCDARTSHVDAGG